MSTELAAIEFHGTGISVLTNERGSWVFPGQLCKHMGLDAEAQRKAIERSHWSKGMTSVMEVMLPGQNRAYPNFALHERRFAMWLANITTSRIADETVRTLIEAYQTEAADVLADWLAKRSAPKPPAQMIPKDYISALEAHLAAEKRARQLEIDLATTEAQKKALVARNSELNDTIRENQPKVESFEQLMESEGTYSFAQAAKLLGIPKLGRNKLFELLRENGLLIGRSREPYQQYIDRGYFEMISTTRPSSGDIPINTYVPRITPKGLEYIRRIVLGA